MIPSTRAGAKLIGSDRYFTGVPCKYGHVSVRIASSGNCLDCYRDYSREYKRRLNDDPAHRAMVNKQIAATQKSDKGRKRSQAYSAKADVKIAVRMSNLISRLLRNKCADRKSIMGYSANELRKHIADKFEEGMSWGNYGAWHIDHIKGRLEYIREGETNPKIINALSNLRPLWASENISRSNTSDAPTPTYFERFK